LPFESRNSAVFFVDFQTLEVFINLGLLELEVNTDLGEFLLLEGGGDKVLDLSLFGKYKVVLVLGQLLLIVFMGVLFLIF
jgi:hypothetical protein